MTNSPERPGLTSKQQGTALGISEAYISRLVDTFYDKIRKHEILGPIFNNAIEDRWPEHLSSMKDFWNSVALGGRKYSGKPVPAHQKHSSIQEAHFGIWLSLFEQALQETAPSSDVIEYFLVRANRIATSLKLALFGLPSLNTTRPRKSP